MTFVGRETELQYLKKYFDSEGSHILVIYGQKGVGKTTLLREFGKDKPFSYYMARSCSDMEQRCQWTGELDVRDDGILEYDGIFEAMMQRGAEGKQILVIDEFHHLIKGNKEFISKLRLFVSNLNGRGDEVLVILCTSASGWVENSLIGKIGNEAAAISGFLKVRDLDIDLIRKIYPEYGEDDCIQLYAVLGGVPGLWNRTVKTFDAMNNLIYCMIDKYGSIHGEMAGVLTEELRETAVYNTILATIASGDGRLNDIYHHTGFSRAKISVYLKNLMEIDLVDKVETGTYRITKPHVRFYFSFIFKNQSLLEELTPEQFYKEIVEDAFPRFVREAYRKS